MKIILEDFFHEKTTELNEFSLNCMINSLYFANQSKCAAKKVCCVIANENNILSIGINGTNSKAPNCNSLFTKIDGEWFEIKYNNGKKVFVSTDRNAHHKWSDLHEIHAEINALAKLNKLSKSGENCDAYVTYSPCNDCAKALGVFGIKRIFYYNDYDNISEVAKVLKEDFGILIYKIPRKYIIDAINSLTETL